MEPDAMSATTAPTGKTPVFYQLEEEHHEPAHDHGRLEDRRDGRDAALPCAMANPALHPPPP